MTETKKITYACLDKTLFVSPSGGEPVHE